jgi:hypothetical protein
VYHYDELPHALRVQIIHIWNTAIGAYFRPTGYSSGQTSPANKQWEFIVSTLRRERGVFALARPSEGPADECKQFLLSADIDGALDMIELSFRVIPRKMQHWEMSLAKISQGPDDVIEELNQRFKEHGIGYQFVEGELIRIDFEFVHAEAVKPALSLLHQAGFDGPSDEFIRAFEHYRQWLRCRIRRMRPIARFANGLHSAAVLLPRQIGHPPNHRLAFLAH